MGVFIGKRAVRLIQKIKVSGNFIEVVCSGIFRLEMPGLDRHAQKCLEGVG